MMDTMARKMSALLAHPALAPVRHRWDLLPPFFQHLVKSLVIGMIAAIVLHQARPYVPGLVGAETTATDWAIKFWQDRSDSSQVAEERFVFLDIDEHTYRAWGEPLFVPRDKLQRLIQFAAEAPAKLVIVDIELTKHVPLQPQPLSSPSFQAQGSSPIADPDQALADYLRRYSERSHDDGTKAGSSAPPRPHIIFARTIGPFSPPEQAESVPGSAETAEPFREERPSEFLETVITASSILHWASPLSDRDDDGRLRNWRLLEPTCIGRTPHAIPSVALLSWAILRTPFMNHAAFSPGLFKEELVRRFVPPFSSCLPSRPASAPAISSSGSSWVLFDAVIAKQLTLSTRPSDLEQRIFYKFHPSTGLADLFSRIPALLVTEWEPRQPLSHDLVAGKTIIIGSSYEAGKDFHSTPIGEMPGAVVLANQINALMEFGQFQEVSREIRWAGLLLLIVIFSLSFSLFTKTWGARISTLVVNAILLPVSLWIFQYGWWLDLVFPLFVLQAYQKFVDMDVTPPPVIRKHQHANERA